MNRFNLHAALFVAGVVVPTWLAPVAHGGMANLALFTAWAVGLMILAFTLTAIALDSPQDQPIHTPRALRWICILSWWSAVAWAAYHGMYWLAALHTVTVAMLKLDRVRKTRERGNS